MSQQCLPLPRSKDSNKSDMKGLTSISGTLAISSLEEMDAMAYLGMVHQEATLLPDTVAKENNAPVRHKSKKIKFDCNDDKESFMAIEGTQVCADLLTSTRMDLVACPSTSLLPKHIWIKSRLAEFETLRGYLDRCIEASIGQDRERRLPVPRMKDREGWHEFCLGRQEAQGNLNGYFDDDSDDSTDDNDSNCDNECPSPPWMNDLPSQGYPPSVSLLLQMDQCMTRHVLSHLTYFLSLNWPISINRLLWIYSLLAHIHKPLHGDDQAVLRLLLRLCTKARAKINSASNNDKDILASINLVITILSFYFQQGNSSVMEVKDSL